MSLAQIRKQYGVPARRGGRVAYHCNDGGTDLGEIVLGKPSWWFLHTAGERGPMLWVRWDGQLHSSPIHPNDISLEYLDRETSK